MTGYLIEVMKEQQKKAKEAKERLGFCARMGFL